jgi:methyl-accepting chemotaxis protein
MKLSLQGKLLAAFGAVLLLTMIVGSIGVLQTGRLNDAAAGMYSDDLVGTGHAAELSQIANRVRADILQHVLATKQTDKAARVADITRLDAEVAETINSIRTGNPDGDLSPYLDRFTQAWTLYAQIRDNQTLAMSRAGHLQQALAAYTGPEARSFAVAESALNALIQGLDTAARATNSEDTSIYDNARNLIATVTILAVLIGLGLAFLLARRISGAVRQVALASESLARGELDSHITISSNDEIGRMAGAFQVMVGHQRAMAGIADAIARGDLSAAVIPQSERDVLGLAFQRMVGNLRAMVTELQQGSQHLAAAGSEILAMTTQQAAGAHEQSAAIAQTTATVAQVKASADHAVRLAGTVYDTAQRAGGIAVEGVTAVANAGAGMSDIRRRMQSIAENILALSEQSQQIGDIIAAVNDLADQSNLLALNAAIEASRAGEQGKGFTVVANEIRTLAEQSKAATAQVRTILSDIQRATNAAVMATEQGTKGVDTGSKLVEDAGMTIDSLAEAIQHAAQSAAQISASVNQHSVGMDQIAVAMTDINQATSQTLAAGRNTEQAAEHLSGLAGRLSALVVHYHL